MYWILVLWWKKIRNRLPTKLTSKFDVLHVNDNRMIDDVKRDWRCGARRVSISVLLHKAANQPRTFAEREIEWCFQHYLSLTLNFFNYYVCVGTFQHTNNPKMLFVVNTCELNELHKISILIHNNHNPSGNNFRKKFFTESQFRYTELSKFFTKSDFKFTEFEFFHSGIFIFEWTII